MRPSERIVQIAAARCRERARLTGEDQTVGIVFNVELEDVAACLNEEQARREKFEADVLGRLDAIEDAWGRRHDP